MFVPADPGIWRGRVDDEDGAAGRRWHQVVRYKQANTNSVALLGFASDLGVQANRGRRGAAAGPAALRQALANQAWHHNLSLFDDGDIRVEEDLEAGQLLFADRVKNLLTSGSFVIGLGGGHEMGWASYLGCRNWLDVHARGKKLGILNLDAHFELRRPEPKSTSATPFYQVSEDCKSQGQEFHYGCMGISRTSNTQALYARARVLGVDFLPDVECKPRAGAQFLQKFLADLDYLYVTCSLNVFPAAVAPGVSVPAALGVEPAWVANMLAYIGHLCREMGVTWLMADVAELSPAHDRDGMTARLAARLIDEMVAAARE